MIQRNGKRAALVLAWVRRQAEPFESSDITGRFGVSQANASQLISRMLKSGAIVKVEGVPYTYRRAEVNRG